MANTVGDETDLKTTKKEPKKGIIYLSTIPPYMNVTKIREIFSEFGEVGRVYLQIAEKDKAVSKKKKSRKFACAKFTEGWIEFNRKSVAKKVVLLLNNKQVSRRKKSRHFDCIWNLKYLSNFKWPHLHERLAYEKAARRHKLRSEIELAKKKTNFFTNNIQKKKGKDTVNKEFAEMDAEELPEEQKEEDRTEFLQSLFP